MNFIKAMNQAGIRYASKHGNISMRMYNHIEINEDIKLSIQVSENHYCTPRRTTNLNDYTNVELAIFYNDEFSSGETVLSGFNRLDELMEYFEGSVFAYVPIDVVEDMYNYLIQ